MGCKDIEIKKIIVCDKDSIPIWNNFDKRVPTFYVIWKKCSIRIKGFHEMTFLHKIAHSFEINRLFLHEIVHEHRILS